MKLMYLNYLRYCPTEGKLAAFRASPIISVPFGLRALRIDEDNVEWINAERGAPAIAWYKGFLAGHELGVYVADGSQHAVAVAWALPNVGRRSLYRWIRIPARSAWVHHVWVAPARRGQGLGTLAISRLVEVVRAYDSSIQIVADTRVDNLPALKMFTASGWVDAGRGTTLEVRGRWLVLKEPRGWGTVRHD